MAKKDWSYHWSIVLLPILCIIIIYTTEALTRYSFFECKNGNCSESIPANIWKVFKTDPNVSESSSVGTVENDKERQFTALRYSGRINWFFLSEIFLLVCLGSLTIAFIISYQVSEHFRLVWAFGVLILSLLIGLFFYTNPQLHMAVFLSLFKHAITPDVPTIPIIINLLNSLGNAALFSLLLAICINLRPPPDDPSSAELNAFAARIKHMNIVLYAGAFLLVTAILLKDSLYQWSLAYMVQDASIEIAKGFVSNLLTWEGGFYTLVLAAAFLPAMLVLQRRAQLMMGTSMGAAERESKLKEMGINFNIKEALPSILAILGPLLTGPISDFLTAKFF